MGVLTRPGQRLVAGDRSSAQLTGDVGPAFMSDGVNGFREVTIVIVTHNMQQAARVSDTCAFFLASHGTPGVIVEHGDTEAMFTDPRDQRTSDYVNGRFG